MKLKAKASFLEMSVQYENIYSPLEGRRGGLKGMRSTCWNGLELRWKLLSGVMVGDLPFAEGLSGHGGVAIQTLGFLLAM